ncbi:MAG: hypothetical protein V4482_05420 [Pseudomonadota bacterium]
MNSLFKILMLSVSFSAPLFASSSSSSCSAFDSSAFDSSTLDREGGRLVSRTAVQTNAYKQKTLNDVHAIIRSRYEFNKDIYSVLKEKHKTNSAKLAYLKDECGYDCLWSEDIFASLVDKLCLGVKRDLLVYQKASQVIFATNPVSVEYLDNVSDELYVFFSLYDKKENYMDTVFTRFAQTTQTPFYESNYIASILDMLQPYISHQAALFSSCLSLAANGATNFGHEDLASAELYESHKEHLAIEGGGEIFRSLLAKHPGDPMSCLVDAMTLSETSKSSQTPEERAALSVYVAVFYENRNSIADPATFATTFYRNVAPALVTLDRFYAHENARRSGEVIADYEEVDGVHRILDAVPEGFIEHNSNDGLELGAQKAAEPGVDVEQDVAEEPGEKGDVDHFRFSAAAFASKLELAAHESAVYASALNLSAYELALAANKPAAYSCDFDKLYIKTSAEASEKVVHQPTQASKKVVKHAKAPAEESQKVVSCDALTVVDTSWKEELRSGGTSRRDFNEITAKMSKALSGEMRIRGNNFMFLFDSLVGKREAITGDVPHGSQTKKQWPAWRKSFVKVFKRVGIID